MPGFIILLKLFFFKLLQFCWLMKYLKPGIQLVQFYQPYCRTHTKEITIIMSFSLLKEITTIRSLSLLKESVTNSATVSVHADVTVSVPADVTVSVPADVRVFVSILCAYYHCHLCYCHSQKTFHFFKKHLQQLLRT